MWLDLVLSGQAALLGLWGSVHCAAMCGPLCAACLPKSRASSPGRPVVAWVHDATPSDESQPEKRFAAILGQGMGRFLAARALSYGVAGWVISASAGALRDVAHWAAWVKPVWLGVHVLLLMAGSWMALTGRWIEAGEPTGGWLGRLVRRARQGGQLDGAWRLAWLWGLWPCGLLYGALMLAALTNHPLWGGAAMVAFALTSAPGLSLGAWMAQGALGRNGRVPVGWVRVSGILISGAALWALAQDALKAFVAWCIA